MEFRRNVSALGRSCTCVVSEQRPHQYERAGRDRMRWGELLLDWNGARVLDVADSLARDCRSHRSLCVSVSERDKREERAVQRRGLGCARGKVDSTASKRTSALSSRLGVSERSNRTERDEERMNSRWMR